jgi:hypothetical protein
VLGLTAATLRQSGEPLEWRWCVDLKCFCDPEQQQPCAAFAAVRILGEMRGEWDKALSLVETALAEAGEAEATGSTDSQPWKRAVNIGKVLHDLASANRTRCAEHERKLSLMAMLEAGRRRETGEAQ